MKTIGFIKDTISQKKLLNKTITNAKMSLY